MCNSKPLPLCIADFRKLRADARIFFPGPPFLAYTNPHNPLDKPSHSRAGSCDLQLRVDGTKGVTMKQISGPRILVLVVGREALYLGIGFIVTAAKLPFISISLELWWRQLLAGHYL
jgi:hypothetical protein